MRLAATAGLALLALSTLTGCGGAGQSFNSALDSCVERDIDLMVEEGEDRDSSADLIQAVYDGTFTVDEDGTTMILDTHSEMGTALAAGMVECVLDDLDAPSSVWERMMSTRALDGTQESSWGDYVVTWNYHPDNGLQSVISKG